VVVVVVVVVKVKLLCDEMFACYCLEWHLHLEDYCVTAFSMSLS
jgi:hypothetical protein